MNNKLSRIIKRPLGYRHSIAYIIAKIMMKVLMTGIMMYKTFLDIYIMYNKNNYYKNNV